ncbi:MAG: hypothetical protein ACLP8S_07670 [Solirubrobacteraceae bacterium]
MSVAERRPADASGSELAIEPAGNSPARRTITITGRGADRSRATGTYDHLNRRSLPARSSRHKPDRIAMWAVLLGIALAVGAATSSHAAVLTAHVALMLGH